LFELVLRIGFSVFIVLGMMWAIARVIRRPLSARRAHGSLAVLNHQQLTRNAAVTVVKVADRAIVLGVTETQVSLLGEAEVADFEKHEHEEHVPLNPDELPGMHPAAAEGRPSPRTWTSTLDLIRDRTSRR
jgi:flagellar protein FliO/FliZ